MQVLALVVLVFKRPSGKNKKNIVSGDLGGLQIVIHVKAEQQRVVINEVWC